MPLLTPLTVADLTSYLQACCKAYTLLGVELRGRRRSASGSCRCSPTPRCTLVLCDADLNLELAGGSRVLMHLMPMHCSASSRLLLQRRTRSASGSCRCSPIWTTAALPLHDADLDSACAGCSRAKIHLMPTRCWEWSRLLLWGRSRSASGSCRCSPTRTSAATRVRRTPLTSSPALPRPCRCWLCLCMH